jgi:hypothetical protein
MKKMSKYLNWIFYAGLGLLNFILLAIPYLTLKVSYGDLGGFAGYYGGLSDYHKGVGGYKVMNLWSGGFGGAMSSLMQLFILLAGIALFVLGAAGFLKELKIAKLPDKIGKFGYEKIGGLLMISLGALNVLLLIFLIIFCAANSESGEYGVFAGYSLNAGIFIALIFTAGAFIGLKLLRKKYPPEQAPAESDAISAEPEKV